MRIGYALSGGVGYGYAHIGVLKVLEKNNIIPDIIVGTSVGSLIGAFLADGKKAEEIENIALKIDWNKILKFTLPKEGLLSIDGIYEILNNNVKIKNIEDSVIKFAVLATDLCDGSEKVFLSGSVADAVRASCSLPGIFSPFRQGEHIYVDGGILNNLPVKTAFDLGADFVIGVDLIAKAFGLNIHHVDIFSIVWKSLQLMIQRNTKLENIEKKLVVIQPDIGKYNPFDLSKKIEIIKKGEEAAEEKIKLIVDKINEKTSIAGKIKEFFTK